MGQAERGAGFEAVKDGLMVFGLRRVGDEQQHEVRFRDDLIHFAQRAIGFGKSSGFGIFHRGRTGPQPNFDFDPRAREGFAEVLRLGRPLRPPSRSRRSVQYFLRLRAICRKDRARRAQCVLACRQGQWFRFQKHCW